MSLFDELMLARQLSFGDGKIELLGQRVVFIEADFISKYIEDINNDPKLVLEMYESTKKTMINGFGVDIGKKYSFSFKDYAKWFVDLAKLSGWGLIAWEEIDEELHKGVISVQNSPMTNYLKGKVTKPCDHVIRGLMAGGASSAFKTDLDILETECESLGSPKCKFIIDSLNNLQEKFPLLAKQQLGK
ncbi:MAG: hypothetical protein KGH59_00560 [Candidatus Micrarchaeota archaeon]|nr:hypothetical protein [Candidatus Micrarchaeota archaeon]